MAIPLHVFLSTLPSGSNAAVDFIRASTPDQTVPTWLHSWHDMGKYLTYRRADARVFGAARRAFLDYRQRKLR